MIIVIVFTIVTIHEYDSRLPAELGVTSYFVTKLHNILLLK